ncbi:MAG: peptidylprolyl isomerase [Algibacter sp.]
MKTYLKVSTSIGDFMIYLDTINAPVTSNYFKNLAEDGLLNHSSVFRIVTESNTEMRSNAKIEVIQLGINNLTSKHSKTLKHETTKNTKLQHKKWAVSAARYEVGQNYPSFFICLRDEPELDHGGLRHPDGEGFAVFGHVVDGFDTVETLFSKAEKTEFLKNEIEISNVKLEYK